MKEYWVDTQGDAKPMFWHKGKVPLVKEAPADFRVGKLLGHPVEEDGVYNILVQKESEDEMFVGSTLVCGGAVGVRAVVGIWC